MQQNIIKPFLIRVLSEQQVQSLKLLHKKIASVSSQLSSLVIGLIPKRIRLWINSVDIFKKMDYDRHEILLNIESNFEYTVRANSCRKDPFTPKWIHGFIKSNDVMFDIGANVGVYSLMTSKNLQSNVTVYAFEPGFLNYRQLCKNILINNCSSSIIPMQIALSEKTSIETFYYNNLTSGGALHALGSPIDQAGNTFEAVCEQPVISFSIDDFIRKFNIPVPNHMKIDVDGTEMAILKGAMTTLQHPSVRSIILELNEVTGEGNPIQEFLVQSGFQRHSKGESHVLNETTIMYNCIFHKK